MISWATSETAVLDLGETQVAYVIGVVPSWARKHGREESTVNSRLDTPRCIDSHRFGLRKTASRKKEIGHD